MVQMLTLFSQFAFVLQHVKRRFNVVADELPRHAVSGDHSNELAVPTNHVTDVSHVVHEYTADCNRHNNLLSRHTVHSALVQYLPLDVPNLTRRLGVAGESRPIGVAREHIHKADFHVVGAHLRKDIVKTSFSERY